jgi:hypothetical protein
MKLVLSLLLVVAFLAPVIARDKKPDISFDKRVNFSSFKTYAWGKGTPAPNPLTDQRIIAGVDARLAAKGWQKVETNPDVMVIYHVSVAPETTINTYSAGGPYDGYQWGWYQYGGGYMGGTVGAGTPTVEINTLQVGELVIDMTDVKNKTFIWRGAAKEAIKDRDPEKIKKKVESAIAALFKNFPPTPGKN